MEVIAQSLDEIIKGLSPLSVGWEDDTALRIIDRLKNLPVKKTYDVSDIQNLLDENFDDGILICRLFLGLSKDQFNSDFKQIRRDQGTGIKAYKADRSGFINDLISMGFLDAMARESNRTMHWSDVLIERLRSGRGSAISGQKRGRGVEDFVESIVNKVFNGKYHSRCTFIGRAGKKAKCDFAIPTAEAPRILIESKGYAATGSKMSDIIGDINAIIRAKRSDTAFLFFTDGLTWNQRRSDLKKIVDYQNNGDIMRIYTNVMAEQFEFDLNQLKSEYQL